MPVGRPEFDNLLRVFSNPVRHLIEQFYLCDYESCEDGDEYELTRVSLYDLLDDIYQTDECLNGQPLPESWKQEIRAWQTTYEKELNATFA